MNKLRVISRKNEPLLFPITYVALCAATWAAIQSIISYDLMHASEVLADSDVLAVMFLTKIGFAVDCVTILVVMLCIRLYFRKTDLPALELAAELEKRQYDELKDAIQEGAPAQSKIYLHWLRWKRALCAMYPQFWAVFWFIMYAGAISMVSLYLYSIHPACEARHDCQQTEASGIYTGR